jgi:hypothetical protein
MPRELLFGAAISIVSLLLGSLLTYATSSAMHRQQQRADNAKRRAEKFELLVGALYDHQHWINIARRVRVFGKSIEEPVSPFAKVEAITHIYFPEFKEQVKAIGKATQAYETWMLQAGLRRLQGEDVGEVVKDQNTVGEPYARALVAMFIEIEKFAQREFR